MNALTNKSVLITGGGSGIGEGIARHFADQGAYVGITGRREQNLIEVVKDLGPQGSYVVGDVTSGDSRKEMIEKTISHGGKKRYPREELERTARAMWYDVDRGRDTDLGTALERRRAPSRPERQS